MSAQGAAIVSLGMMSAVGIGAQQTASSVRAGISRFCETSIYDRRFQPFTMALVSDECLPPLERSLVETNGLTARQARMLRLAAPALSETLRGVSNVGEIPVLVGTPEALPGRTDPAGEKFLERLIVQSGLKFNLGRSKMFPNGRAAGLLALQEALVRLQSGEDGHVIVGGVDTYLDLYLLGTLDMEGRILAKGVMDGFVPGEGAAFLLLSTGKKVVSAKTRSAWIAGTATGVEMGHRYSEESYRGDGLASTVQELFAAIPSVKDNVQTVFVGFNGENFWAKEWGVAYLRSKERFQENVRIEHPADCFGDSGAAMGPLLLGLGAIGMQKGYVEGPCLVWCSSDREERGAALIHMN
jgi:3-oxoacyl-[acyl-carrier-protein] synthase-1